MSAGLLVEPSTAVFVILGREKSTMKHRFSPNEELSCFHVNALMLKKKNRCEVKEQGTAEHVRLVGRIRTEPWCLSWALQHRRGWMRAAIFTARKAGRRLLISRMALCCSHPTSWPQNNPTNRLSVEQMVRWGVRGMPVSTLLEQGCFFCGGSCWCARAEWSRGMVFAHFQNRRSRGYYKLKLKEFIIGNC